MHDLNGDKERFGPNDLALSMNCSANPIERILEEINGDKYCELALKSQEREFQEHYVRR